MSILLRIAYDGTEFSGWARQRQRADGSPIRTVQGEIEAALSRLFGQSVTLRGASRTDAGVHAYGQLAAFEPPSAIPARGVLEALAGRLPADVTVLAAWDEDGVADVRGGNDGKRYRYVIRTTRGRDPVARDEWHLGRRLDVDAMVDAAGALVGRHDFSAFRSAHCQAKTPVRTVTGVAVHAAAAPLGPPTDPGRIELPKHAPQDADDPAATGDGRDRVIIEVEGHAFLHNMVRIIAGTLCEVGLGRRDREGVARLIEEGDRRQAGPTAPACGLTLLEVRWPSLASRA